MIETALADIVADDHRRRSWGSGMCWHLEQVREGMPGQPLEPVLWTLYQECDGGRWYLVTNLPPEVRWQHIADALGLLRDNLNKGLKPAETQPIG